MKIKFNFFSFILTLWHICCLQKKKKELGAEGCFIFISSSTCALHSTNVRGYGGVSSFRLHADTELILTVEITWRKAEHGITVTTRLMGNAGKLPPHLVCIDCLKSRILFVKKDLRDSNLTYVCICIVSRPERSSGMLIFPIPFSLSAEKNTSEFIIHIAMLCSKSFVCIPNLLCPCLGFLWGYRIATLGFQ